MERVYQSILYVEDSAVGICFPDFPGCISSGDNLENALKNGREALELHIEGMLEDKEDIPLSSNASLILDYMKENPGGMLALVTVEIPEGRSKRVDITIPEFLLAKVDRKAREEHSNRSKLIARSLASYIS